MPGLTAFFQGIDQDRIASAPEEILEVKFQIHVTVKVGSVNSTRMSISLSGRASLRTAEPNIPIFRTPKRFLISGAARVRSSTRRLPPWTARLSEDLRSTHSSISERLNFRSLPTFRAGSPHRSTHL